MNLNNSFVKPPPGFSALSVRRSSPSIINDDEFIDSISTYQTAVNEVQQHTQRNIDSSVYLECKEELTITNQLQQQQQQPPLSKWNAGGGGDGRPDRAKLNVDNRFHHDPQRRRPFVSNKEKRKKMYHVNMQLVVTANEELNVDLFM